MWVLLASSRHSTKLLLCSGRAPAFNLGVGSNNPFVQMTYFNFAHFQSLDDFLENGWSCCPPALAKTPSGKLASKADFLCLLWGSVGGNFVGFWGEIYFNQTLLHSFASQELQASAARSALVARREAVLSSNVHACMHESIGKNQMVREGAIKGTWLPAEKSRRR